MISNDNISLFELASRYSNLTITVSFDELLEVIRRVYHEENLKKNQSVEKQDEDEMLTEKEVIKILKVSHSTIYRWQQEEYLVAHYVGCKKFFSKKDVMRIIN